LGRLNPGSNPGGPTLKFRIDIRRIKMSSAKRFGARYGRKTRQVFARHEMSSRAKHKCPVCNKVNVKRLAMGIWQCRSVSCGAKIAGRAYSVA